MAMPHTNKDFRYFQCGFGNPYNNFSTSLPMNMFSSFLETMQSTLRKVCTSLQQLPIYFDNISLYCSTRDGCIVQLVCGFVASLVLMAYTYFILHQRDIEATQSRKQSPRASLPFMIYAVTWCLLFGAAFSQMQDSIVKVFAQKNMYHAIASIGVVCALIVSLWTLGSSVHYFQTLLVAAIPSILLILYSISLWYTSFELAIMIMLTSFLLLYILMPFLTSRWSNLYSGYASSLSRAFNILAKGSLGILPILIALSFLGAFQCSVIDALIDGLGLDTIRIPYNNTRIALGYPLKLALIGFSLESIRLFISVFISSKVYMDLSKEKNSLSSSLIRAITSMKMIAVASFIPAILWFLRGLYHILHESEMEKQPKDRNIIHIAIVRTISVITSFITSIIEEVNSLTMNYIGVYGGSYDSKMHRKATNHVSRHFGYYIYTASGIRYCLVPLLLIFWYAILLLFRDFLLPIESGNGFILASILTILYSVDCVHSAIISVFYYEIDSARKLQRVQVNSEINWRF